MKKLLNLPNLLTILRMLMIPVFAKMYYSDMQAASMLVFLLASATDVLDGYLARKWNQITSFGKLMDPLADKILVMAAMCYFVEVRRMPGWALAIVLLREFAVSGMRLIAVEQGRVIAAGWSGKVKTASTMVCIVLMFLPIPAVVNTVCVWVITLTTLYSGVEYFMKNKDVIQSA